MRKLAIIGMLTALITLSTAVRAQEAGGFPAPQKEHEWLKQLVGEWNTDAEAIIDPSQPPFKCKGTESVRAVGGFWVLSETKSTPMGVPMTGVLTVGYDPAKKKYIGSWVDSMTNHMWRYEGTLDASGKKLTLEAEGPNPMAPGKVAKFRDAYEIKSKDHKVLTSSMQLEDGKWVTFLTSHYRRKK